MCFRTIIICMRNDGPCEDLGPRIFPSSKGKHLCRRTGEINLCLDVGLSSALEIDIQQRDREGSWYPSDGPTKITPEVSSCHHWGAYNCYTHFTHNPQQHLVRDGRSGICLARECHVVEDEIAFDPRTNPGWMIPRDSELPVASSLMSRADPVFRTTFLGM